MKHWRVLAQRYRHALQLAWQRRGAPPLSRPAAEWAFLAPALALQQRPPAVLPRLLLGLILGVVVLAVLWATFGQVDVVASARGKVVPSGRSKVIQPRETAVVKAIHVQDGQPVQAGQVLIELEARATAADIARLQAELLAAHTDLARALAMVGSLETDRPPQLADGALAAASPPARRAAQRWLDGQYLELRSQLDQADADIARAGYERDSLDVSIQALSAILPITRELADDYAALFAEQAVAKHQYLQRKQEYLGQQREFVQLQARRKETSAAWQAATHRRTHVIAQQRRSMLELQHDAQARAESTEQELRKARVRHGLRTLNAPVAGTVQQLRVHTHGGVVTEAQPLMVIVPSGQQIEVEAFLENKDIGFVHPGQLAQLKVETFSYIRYGLARGVVSSVSHDAIEDEQRGLVYAVRIRLDDHLPARPGQRPLPLTPGMAVTAEITTRQRSLISYFLTPLEVMRQESLRER